MSRGADLVQRARPARPGPARRRIRAPDRAREDLHPGRAGACDQQFRPRRVRPSAERSAAGARRPHRRARRPARPRAAVTAALSPATPPPITSTSQWRRRYSVCQLRSSWRSGSRPRPAALTQHLLVDRPQPPRADERLVVEADRRERAAELVGRAHHVEAQRRPRVLMARRASPRLTGSEQARTPGRPSTSTSELAHCPQPQSSPRGR